MPNNKSPEIVEVGTVEAADLLPFAGELADARDFNATWNYDPYDFAVGLPGLLHDPREYSTLRSNPVYGLLGDWDASRPGENNVRDQIDSGRIMDVGADGTITWGFYDFRSKTGPNSSHEGKGYFPFTEAQKVEARESIKGWDDLIAPSFTELDYNGQSAKMWAHNDIDILLANTTTGPAQAWAYYPGQGNAYIRASGDVWIGASPDNYTDLFDGGYGQATQVHELGHSLGLSHPGNYDFGDDNDGDGVPDPITYDGDAFYFQDSRTYTTMSYFDTYETGNNMVDYNYMRVLYPSTPMVHDVWVVQQKYGADYSTRAGDSVYGFNSTSDVTNSAMKFVDGDRMTMFTIWDGAGNDTLDLSGYYTPSIIDLREGSYSSAGGLGAYDAAWVGQIPDANKDAYLAFVNANNAELGLASRSAAYDLYFGGRPGANEGVPWSDFNGRDFLMENNIGIAYGAVIENAIGGHGDDRINGNQATNKLTGGAGADTFIMADFSGPTLDGKVLVDTRLDIITDFTTGEDRIDLTEFASVDAANVSYAGGKLLIDTDDNGVADFTVDLLGATINLASDIVYHG